MSTTPKIRPLAQNDLKAVRYLLGLSVMEPLGAANNKAYFHPLTIAVWMGLAAIMVQFMNWWPKPDKGWLTYLSPLPAMGATAVPVMFFFDWIHRPAFEERVKKTLTAPDMRDPLRHYSSSRASGFYILEYKAKIIGLIAVDASTAPIAVIRHFFVEEAYRGTQVQEDLLKFALEKTFGAGSRPSPSLVRTLSSDLTQYTKSVIQASGFRAVSKWEEKEPQEWTVGIYKWGNRWVELSRTEWQARQEKKKD